MNPGMKYWSPCTPSVMAASLLNYVLFKAKYYILLTAFSVSLSVPPAHTQQISCLMQYFVPAIALHVTPLIVVNLSHNSHRNERSNGPTMIYGI